MIRAFLKYPARTFRDQYPLEDHKFVISYKDNEYFLSVFEEEKILDRSNRIKDIKSREVLQACIPADVFANAYSDFLKRNGLGQKISQAINEGKLKEFLSGSWKPDVNFHVITTDKEEAGD